MENEKKDGQLRKRTRSDLQYKLFVYVTREVDIFIRRLAMRKNQSNSRVVDDILKEYKRNFKNARVDGQTQASEE